MCKAVLKVVPVALGLTTALTPNVSAQSIDSLLERIDRLSTQWVELDRQASLFDSVQTTADSIADARIRYETITDGPLRVVVDARHSNEARPAVAAAARSLRENLGTTLQLIEGQTFTVTLYETRVPGSGPPRVKTETRLRVDTDRVTGITRGVAVETEDIVTQLRNVIVRAVDRSLTNMVPAEIISFAGPISPTQQSYDMRRSYLDLVGNPTSAARACWNRDYTACRIGLGLAPAADPLLEWYTDADRRELVAKAAGPYETRSTSQRDLLERCDLESCLTFLRRQGYQSPPFHSMHATEVTLAALRAGGAGAFARLVTAPGSVVERLEATAQMPFDSILARWRTDIDAAVGTPVRVTVRTGITTIIWTLVFMFAATRSTRWRLH